MNIREILEKAYQKKASDIHIIPGCPVMFRINGQMCAQEEICTEKTDIEHFLQELLTKEQFVTLEQEGEIDTAVTLPEFSRVRANIYRQQGIYAIAVRMLSATIPTPEELELPKAVTDLTKENKGLVLITGEAGNGKTTTIVSLLHKIAETETKNIITIENPIEYVIPHEKSMISQREIGSDTTSYAKAVKAALRQDPDVIFIGELSDADTILEAIAAAEAGHLVFSSLHTNRAEDTLHRLIDIFPEHRRQQIRVQLADVLKGIVAQCLVPYQQAEERKALFEIMSVDKEIQTLLREDRISQIPSAMESKKNVRMQTLDDALLEAYMKCQISAETAVSYAFDSERMKERTKIY